MVALAVVSLGALGSVLRWQVGLWANQRVPWGTLAVNVAGSFALGLLSTASSTTVTVLGVGFLGSLTTFSTLMAEVGLSERRAAPPRGPLVAYLVVTLTAGIAAAGLGLHWSG